MPPSPATHKIAIIPARAGSKGLPGKNIKPLGGAPLISWTIKAALASGCFDRVIVSTDSPEIRDISQDAGAEVPFLRPEALATSTATSADVVQHVLDACEAYCDFALLQPTSPFRSAKMLQDAVTIFDEKKAQSVIAITEGKPVNWALSRDAQSRLGHHDPDKAQVSRRQDAAQIYYPNGAIYLCDYAFFAAEQKFISTQCFGYDMTAIDSLDIDVPEDFQIAEAIVGAGLRHIDHV